MSIRAYIRNALCIAMAVTAYASFAVIKIVILAALSPLIILDLWLEEIPLDQWWANVKPMVFWDPFVLSDPGPGRR
jgi:hypothetical protein